MPTQNIALTRQPLKPSFSALRQAVRAAPLSSSAKLLAYVLADYANASFECFPSIARLVADTSLSRRTLLRCFSELEFCGLLKRVNRSRLDGGQTSSIYQFLIHSDASVLAPPPVPLWHPPRATVAPHELRHLTKISELEPTLTHNLSVFKKNNIKTVESRTNDSELEPYSPHPRESVR